MNFELLRTWLQLPADPWPPNYYVLLNLPLGKGSAEEIEGHVLDRMELLRKYQLAHPEQVTEGMNLLAKALDCLTDPVVRQSYDKRLGIHSIAGEEVPLELEEETLEDSSFDEDPSQDGSSSVDEDSSIETDGVPIAPVIELPWNENLKPPTKSQSPTVLDRKTTSSSTPASDPSVPPERHGKLRKALLIPDLDEEDGEPMLLEMVEHPRPILEPLEDEFAIPSKKKTKVLPPDLPVASVSTAPVLGPVLGLIGPKPATRKQKRRSKRRKRYADLVRVRRMLRIWERTKIYFVDADAMIARRSDTLALMANFAEMRPLWSTVQDLIGGPQQPGNLIAAVAKQPLSFQTFRSLLQSQRLALVLDFRAAHFKLVERYESIRGVIKRQNRKDWSRRIFFPLLRYFYKHPEWILILIGLASLAIAVHRSSIVSTLTMR